MGLITTVVLIALNSAGTLALGWWSNSVLESFVQLVLLGLGAGVFYFEERWHSLTWRAHMAYWAISLVNITAVFYLTNANGWFLALLILNLAGLLRAISRLDAQAAGITYPVTFEGNHQWSAQPVADAQKQSSSSQKAHSPKSDVEALYLPTLVKAASSTKPGVPSKAFDAMDDPMVVLEDQPEVQVELETYKEGENAIPIVSTSSARYNRDIDALMKRVSADLKRQSSKSVKKAKRVKRKSSTRRKRR